MESWIPPDQHPISLEKAKELMAGDLADVYRSILSACCAPIYWFRLDVKNFQILHNGTITFIKTPKKLLGVTAAHVLRAYECVRQQEPVRLQVMNGIVDDVLDRVIDISDKLDIATINVDHGFLRRLGKTVTPLSCWPPSPPQEGRGIMLAGYPGVERKAEGMDVNFGLFTALGVARTVSEVQITWLPERDQQLKNATIPPPPPNYNLGGISGGPLISWFEGAEFVAHHVLSGIITEHPDYENNEFSVERLVAIRADVIRDSGTIGT